MIFFQKFDFLIDINEINIIYINKCLKILNILK